HQRHRFDLLHSVFDDRLEVVETTTWIHVTSLVISSLCDGKARVKRPRRKSPRLDETGTAGGLPTLGYSSHCCTSYARTVRYCEGVRGTGDWTPGRCGLLSQSTDDATGPPA